MGDTRTSRTPTLKLGGSPLADVVANALVNVDVRLALHTAGTATVRFADPDFTLFDKPAFQIGAALVVLLPGKSNSQTAVFTGEVTAVGMEHDRSGGATPMLVVEARDGSHRLATASTFKAYLKQSPADVVKEIAGRHGLTPKVEGGATKEPYLLQSGTDHAFVSELARGLGYEWFTDGKELHFRPRKDQKGPSLKRSDGTLLRFTARYTGTHSPSEIQVMSWDPAQMKGIVGKAGSALNGSATDLGSTAPFVSEQYKKGKSSFGKALDVGEIGARDAAEADAIAQGLAKQLVGDGLRVEGVAACNPDVKAGGLVSIDEVGTKLKGSYYVTEVSHSFGPEQEVVTSFVCGRLDVEEPTWSPRPAGDGSWATRGPVVGVVTNLTDPEKQGRVKVKFPSLGANVESNWARVATVGAGPERGFDARPEVNDEVLVVFERGDTRFPIVVGGLWNGKHKLPRAGLEKDGKTTSRIFKSRTGHTLEFCDADGADKQHVTIVTGDTKTKLVLGQKGVTLESGDGDLVLKSGSAQITLKKSGDIELKGKAVKVEGSAAVNVKAGQALELKGSTGIKADGGTAFEAKGAQAKVEGSGMLTLKGGMVKIN